MKYLITTVLMALFLLGCKNENDKQLAELSQNSSVILFQVLATEKDDIDYYDDGIIPWISIEMADIEIENLIGKDDIVISSSNAVLIIDYPLSKSVEINLQSNKQSGFTRKKLIEKISSEYKRIYREEEESAKIKTIPIEERKTMINRNQTDGIYGIWGHDLGDLDLSSIIVTQKNGSVFLELIIES